MKSMLKLLVPLALVASVSLAQEIGTEINTATPNSNVNQPNNNNSNTANSNTSSNANTGSNTGSNTSSSGNSSGNTGYKPKPKEGASTWDGPQASAAGGSFGFRASFGASGSTALPTSSGANAAVAAPSVGIAFLATDSFKLLIDVGFGLGIVGSAALLAVGTTIGFDYLFRTPGDSLRPFIHFAGSFSISGSNNFLIGFGAQVGGGAEYFFSPSFSVNGRLLLAVPMAIPGDFVLGIFTVTPGVGATWYL